MPEGGDGGGEAAADGEAQESESLEEIVEGEEYPDTEDSGEDHNSKNTYQYQSGDFSKATGDSDKEVVHATKDDAKHPSHLEGLLYDFAHVGHNLKQHTDPRAAKARAAYNKEAIAHAKDRGERYIVVALPGSLQGQATFDDLRRELRANYGIDLITISYNGRDLDGSGLAQIDSQVRSHLKATGAEKAILLGHSLGGIAARLYATGEGKDVIAKVVTMGTPHSYVKDWPIFEKPFQVIYPDTGRQIIKYSGKHPWSSKRTPYNIPHVSLWTYSDSLVPPESAQFHTRAGNKRSTAVPVRGHSGFLHQPKVIAPYVAESIQYGSDARHIHSRIQRSHKQMGRMERDDHTDPRLHYRAYLQHQRPITWAYPVRTFQAGSLHEISTHPNVPHEDRISRIQYIDMSQVRTGMEPLNAYGYRDTVATLGRGEYSNFNGVQKAA